MERKILGIKLADRVKCSKIRKRTQIQDIVDFVAKQKWKWAGHAVRLRTTDGPYESPNGNPGTAKDQEDKQDDGETTL
ncbi:endonuclease-reverse transcriptase [Plakobranchus ocellatus]|uniref:Endonuclease-reverse transcriptase n=1 Tax=Plakobranchus ocellatus TaxID=259542 RepID=A0AAV4DAN4_9GAST|nr:endonuclease-reverse transcriptase [Plakobranchus ocellatus]